MFGQNREELRRFYKTSWDKRCAGEPLQPLERLVAEVVAQHPEYHTLLSGSGALQRDFDATDGEVNPWLHMGMHVTLGEQITADRPPGIRGIYHRIMLRLGDAHSTEHAMMDCLGMSLWEAQRANALPDERHYIDCLKKLGG
ncbi:MAG: DUF1841 family protein [Chromatiaceae bacterium]|nr:DUF1841 family protein [Gammaproteobacteria bacterium]MCP5303928.1 DUF1841 family protein [Chromatiaceae bacterium]MCP5313655.1 DUF1841 family protein [Chromatiaceae bacterium]